MNKEFQVDRHNRLWVERTKQVRRVVSGSLLFGALILFNVLQPYSQDLDERNTIELEIRSIENEIESIETTLGPLRELNKVLAAVQEQVDARPWDAEKDKLIREFRSLNRRGVASRVDYQTRADATIRAVGEMVTRTVVAPLEAFLTDTSVSNKLMPALAGELRTVPKAVESWVDENLGKRWYVTLEMKAAHLNRLTRTLDRKLDAVARIIRRDRPELERRQEELQSRLSALTNDTNYRDKKKRLQDLQKQMEMILPSWIRGMISVEEMLQLYPFIVVVLAIYVMALAVSGASHYRFLAETLDFAEAGRQDPGFSSLWTLTYRGRLGTLQTIGVYVLFIAAMWFFFESGAAIFAEWLTARETALLDANTFAAFRWLCRLALLALLGVAGYPFRQRAATAGQA